METMPLCRSCGPLFSKSAPLLPLPPPPPLLLIRAIAAPRTSTRPMATRKGTAVYPVGEPGPREISDGAQPVTLLSNVEKLRLLTKAEKAGLLSAAESFGLSLSSVERLGLLSKAEELGVLSAATDTSTPGTLLGLSVALLLLGPAFAFAVPEDYPWQVALQLAVALLCVLGGSAAIAASNFVARLQRSGR